MVVLPTSVERTALHARADGVDERLVAGPAEKERDRAQLARNPAG